MSVSGVFQVIIKVYKNWAGAWQHQQDDLCLQQRLRSACTSAESDQSSLWGWRTFGSLVHSTRQMPRLIWVFAGAQVILFFSEIFRAQAQIFLTNIKNLIDCGLTSQSALWRPCLDVAFEFAALLPDLRHQNSSPASCFWHQALLLSFWQLCCKDII